MPSVRDPSERLERPRGKAHRIWKQFINFFCSPDTIDPTKAFWKSVEALSNCTSKYATLLDEGTVGPDVHEMIKEVCDLLVDMLTAAQALNTMTDSTTAIQNLVDCFNRFISVQEDEFANMHTVKVHNFIRDLSTQIKRWANDKNNGRYWRLISISNPMDELPLLLSCLQVARIRFKTNILDVMEYYEEQLANERLQLLDPLWKATVDSYRKDSPLSFCLPGTRVAILSEIKKWVMEKENGIYWLHGPAGTGKSTIAVTIANWAQKEGYLGGNFFFPSRSSFSPSTSNVSDAHRLFPTLAYQMANSDQPIKPVIASVAKAFSRNKKEGLAFQFQQLIAGPLNIDSKPNSCPSSSQPPSVALLVIDALNECVNIKDAEEIVELLLNGVSELRNQGVFLRVLITSRPTHRIQSKLCGSPLARIAGIEDWPIKPDIDAYLRHNLSSIANHSPYILPKKLTFFWVDDTRLHMLLEICHSLFYLAAVAVKFIGNRNCGSPTYQLRYLLDAPTREVAFGKPLNRLYMSILSDIYGEAKLDPDELLQISHILISMVSWSTQTLECSTLAAFLGVEVDAILKSLKVLDSIIVMSSERAVLTFIHPWFSTFLKDNTRRPEYFPQVSDDRERERFMYDRCAALIMRQLQQRFIDSTCLEDAQDEMAVYWDTHPGSKGASSYAITNWQTHFGGSSFEGDDLVEKLIPLLIDRRALIDWSSSLLDDIHIEECWAS